MMANRYENEQGSEVNSGSCSLDPVVGQYRKRAPKKKPWVIRWEWTGDRTGMNKLQRMLCESSRPICEACKWARLYDYYMK
jgi:endonuclease III